MNVPHRILALSPHTDDIEVACGGTIMYHMSKGNEVYEIAFSTSPRKQRHSELEKECVLASKVLGIMDVNVHNFDMREFPSQRQEILDVLIKVRDSFSPTIVFTPATTDTHQDHQVVTQEAIRAFKQSTILGYELPWNNTTFTSVAFQPLTNEHIERKINAVTCYKSQLKLYPYLNEDFIRSLAMTRGIQIKVKYAEAFEVIRWVMS